MKTTDKTSRSKDKCKTCQGYGFWAIGMKTSMGYHDSHNYPTLPCPECKADANPIKNYDIEV